MPLIFEQGEPDGEEDRWFAALGAHVADILHEVGVPYCKGGVMAQQRAVARLGRDLEATASTHWIRRSRACGPAVCRYLLRPAGRSTATAVLPSR